MSGFYPVFTEQVRRQTSEKCPSCESGDADIRKHGLLAGTAKCNDCNHIWRWKNGDNLSDSVKDQLSQIQKRKSLSNQDNYTFFGRNPNKDNTDSDKNKGMSTTATAKTTSGGSSSDTVVLTKMPYTQDAIANVHKKMDALKRLQSVSNFKPVYFKKNQSNNDNPSMSKTEDKEAHNQEDDDGVSLFSPSWPKKKLDSKKSKKRKNYSDEYSDDYEEEEDYGNRDDYVGHEESGSEFEPEADDSDGYDNNKTKNRNRSIASTSASAAKTKTVKKASKAKTAKTTKQQQDSNFSDDSDAIFSDPEVDVFDEPSHKKESHVTQLNNYKRKKPRPINSTSVFMLFNKEHRKRICQENPGLSASELSKKVSEAYQNMPESEKERYQGIADRHKKEINKNRHVRERNQGFPGNAYIQYTKYMGPKVYAEHPEMSFKDRSSLVTAGWKALSEEEKEAYREKSRILTEKFYKENPEYVIAKNKRALEKRMNTQRKKNLKKKMAKY
ncbi:hypothetical protein BDA99DRAFT_524016 [Phascolomyces articulosus]|uniref:HMG box domain-containing protein n=1 Tax=Phascolomyces articulosus TaxID=60185 RepID=A0AAD5JZZ4_9FUNG|nr:hypothetical protein BDA99DRAFT_524016 [Phascolomyces articulosus]